MISFHFNKKNIRDMFKNYRTEKKNYIPSFLFYRNDRDSNNLN